MPPFLNLLLEAWAAMADGSGGSADGAARDGSSLKAAEHFRNFMRSCAAIEEGTARAGRRLSDLHLALQALRRPPPPASSPLVAELLGRPGLDTPAVRAYVAAGCRVARNDARTAVTITESFRSLGEHMTEVKEALESIRESLAAAVSLCRSAPSSCCQVSLPREKDAAGGEQGTGGAGSERSPPGPHEGIGATPAVPGGVAGHGPCEPVIGPPSTGLTAVDFATMMAAIAGMLEEEAQMQQAVVGALSLDTPAEELQSYVTFWLLRPFVDERVMLAAMEWL